MADVGERHSDPLQASVVVPARDRANLLANTLDSLVRQSADPHSYEIVVCDDGSAEPLSPLISRFQPGPPAVRLLVQPAKGPAAARNLGIRSSRSPLIVFLDSDVTAEPELIRRLVSALAENPAWLGAEASLIPSGGSSGPLWDAPVSLSGGRFHTAAIAYRRSALVAAGGLDEVFDLPACEDVELAARVLERGDVGFVPEARVLHPRRRVTFGTHWGWRTHWKYLLILAKRYGFLAFPGHRAGSFPRLRIALAAVVTLPAGRFQEGLRHMKQEASEGFLACLHAVFDIFCGLWVLPEILTAHVPERRKYL